MTQGTEQFIESLMNSEYGSELLVAWNDGDEARAESIINSNTKDEALIEAALDYMF